MDHQNWDTIYVHLDKQSKQKSDDKPVQKIKSKEKRFDDKIEEGTMSHKKISASLGKEFQQFRNSKKWTQKEVAQKINKPVKDIIAFENGTLQHNPQLIQKIKRLMR